MTTKNQTGLGLPVTTACRPHLSRRASAIGLAAGTLMALYAVGAAGPAFAQAQLELCTLDISEGGTVEDLQSDVATALGINPGDVEVAFVVVYSLNNDNHGQPVSGATTGPVLCTNPAVTGAPSETTADTPIPDSEDPDDTVDIFDSAEAFLLRYADSETEALPESRFCHTTNANVDCFLLGPAPIVE